jgi:hypothetical protein
VLWLNFFVRLRACISISEEFIFSPFRSSTLSFFGENACIKLSEEMSLRGYCFFAFRFFVFAQIYDCGSGEFVEVSYESWIVDYVSEYKVEG